MNKHNCQLNGHESEQTLGDSKGQVVVYVVVYDML